MVRYRGNRWGHCEEKTGGLSSGIGATASISSKNSSRANRRTSTSVLAGGLRVFT